MPELSTVLLDPPLRSALMLTKASSYERSAMLLTSLILVPPTGILLPPVLLFFRKILSRMLLFLFLERSSSSVGSVNCISVSSSVYSTLGAPRRSDRLVVFFLLESSFSFSFFYLKAWSVSIIFWRSAGIFNWLAWYRPAFPLSSSRSFSLFACF